MNLELEITNERFLARLAMSDGSVVISREYAWPRDIGALPQLRDTLAITLLMEVLREGLLQLNGPISTPGIRVPPRPPKQCELENKAASEKPA
jgi:hypothetical protein